MSQSDSPPQNQGWNRKQVSFRLSDRRMARLRFLASQMRTGATPTDALDLALEIATAPRFEPVAAQSDDLDSAADGKFAPLLARIEAALALRNSTDKAALSRVESHLAVLSAKVTSISDLVSVAAASADSEGDGEMGESEESPPSLREWLARESKALGLSIRSSAILQAQWQATRRTSDTYVTMDFSASVAAIDGARPRNDQRLPSQFRVDLVRTDEQFSRISSGGRFGLSCRPASGGVWNVEVFAVDANGGERKIIASRAC